MGRDAAAAPQSRCRGAELLLEHCVLLDRLDPPRLSAVSRLEHALGGELTRLLLVALAGDHGMRLRELPG